MTGSKFREKVPISRSILPAYALAFISFTSVLFFLFAGLAFATHGNNNIKGHSDLEAFADVGERVTCYGCHPRSSAALGDSATQQQYDFHMTHGRSPLLKGQMKTCTYCHKTVPVEDKTSPINKTSSAIWGKSTNTVDGTSMEGDKSNTIASTETYSYNGLTNGLPLRKFVSPAICNRCHGKFTYKTHDQVCVLCHGPGGPEEDSITRLSSTSGVVVQEEGDDDRHDCSWCHSARGPGMTAAKAHSLVGPDGTSANMRITTRANNFLYCIKCHGGKQFFETEESNYFNGITNDPDTSWNQ